jgi:hypothetical protein
MSDEMKTESLSANREPLTEGAEGLPFLGSGPAARVDKKRGLEI